MVGAAAVAGFALSQWLVENERAAQGTLEHELRARADEAARTASQLAVTSAGARAEIEMGVLRRLGTDGVIVMTTVGPCRPALVVSAPGTASPPNGVSTEPAPPPAAAAASACTETEANTITLCATVPGNARVTEVEVFAREANAETPWSSNRLNPGKEVGQARFAEKFAERPDPEQPGMKQVCQDFAHWSTEHAQVARMQVRYTI